MKLRTCLTALVTPFRNGAIDDRAFGDLVEWQVAQGIGGLVPVGTTGETATLTDDEHQRVVRMCVEAAAGRVPVVAGAGSNETAVSVRYAEHAKALGADAVLVVTPYYNKPSQEGLFRHFEEVAKVGIPVVVYNIPGRSVVDMGTDTMARVSRIPGVVGVKDATADIGRVQLYLDHCEEGFQQLSGDDETVLPYLALGGDGLINVGSNVAPAKYAALVAAVHAGDLVEARRLNGELQGLHKALFHAPNPAPAKYALSRLGMMSPEVRLPMVECPESVKRDVEAAMERAGVEL